MALALPKPLVLPGPFHKRNIRALKYFDQSDTHAVLATVKRSESELSSYQRKVFKIDDHMGIAIAGLTADGRVLCRYMRNECLNHR